MASTLIGSLRVALGLDTAQFEAGAAKAATIARSKSKQIESSFASAKTAVTGFFAAFTVGLLAEQIKKSLDYAGSLAEVSRTLGVTTKDLQTFRFAATQSGVAQDQLEVGLRRLTVSMGKAELGSKLQAKAFGAIGISLDQLKGKNTGDVFRLMADGLSKVTDRSQRAAIEMTLMGRSGSTLDNLLAPGSQRLNELAQAAQRLGIVLSDQQIQGAEETAHKLAAVKAVLAAQIAGVVADNAQSILTLANSLGQLTAQVAKFMAQNPAVAFGLIGMLTGRALLGPVGGAIGLIAGATYGSQINIPFNPAANPDTALLVHNLRDQNDHLKAMLKLGGVPAATVDAQKAKVIRLTNNLNAALGRNSPPQVQPGPDLPKIFAGKDKKPKKGPKDKNEEDEFQFAQAQRQADLEILDAKKQLSHDYVEQTTIAIAMLDVQKQIKDAEIDHKVAQAQRDYAEHKITRSTLDEITAQAGIAKVKEDTLDHLKRQEVLEAEQEHRFKDVAALDQQRLELRKQHLEDELALATTAKERRDLELQILGIDHQIQKAKLEEVLADTQASASDKEHARLGLIELTHNQGLKRQDVLNRTAGPLGQYLLSLPTNADKWKEALQNVAVDGFGAITNAADVLAGKIVKVGGIFGDVTRTIIADLLKIELQKLVIAPLANALGGLFGGNSGLGQSLFPVVNGVDPLAALPPHALGGSIAIGGNMGTDRNLLSLNGVPIARVSHGETLNVDPNGGGSDRIVINQTIAPQLAGNGVTQNDLLQMAIITKQAAVDAVRELGRRKS